MVYPCLEVDEILRAIANELVGSGARATAAALARCCKSFEDPVLDSLWETQEQLLPLLKSFPGDVWKINEAGQFVCFLVISIPFSPPDRFAGEVFQQDPDQSGMEPFQETRSSNATAHRTFARRPNRRRCSTIDTSPQRQRSIPSKHGELRVR